jgi:hypothetical protein
MVNRSSVGMSQNMLPRPHHTIEKFKIASIESKKFKNAGGYNSDFTDILQNNAISGNRPFVQDLGRTITDLGGELNSAKNSYQPVPDGRFYTKANFFTLQDRNEVDVLSSEDNGSVFKKSSAAGAVVPFPSYSYHPKTQNPSQSMQRQ